MTSTLKGLLGLNTSKNPCSIASERSPRRALPANWYTSQALYELERRSIFARNWLLTTHSLRLPKLGAWLRYETAGWYFVLFRDNNNVIKAFHDVSAHETEEQIDQPKDFLGQGYANSSPIHIHIDRNGFIWVNLDSNEEPEIEWERDFKDIDLQPRFSDFDWNNYAFDHTWEMDGAYNWKVLADNYNECYHCATAHPDVQSVADLNSYSVDTVDGSIIHLPASTPEQIKAGLKVCSTYYFPNASMTVTPHFFFMQRFIPTSPKTCQMRYEVFRNKHSSDADFILVSDMFKRIMNEDKHLCIEAQKNLSSGIFVNGLLHPEMEKGPLYFQSVVRDIVKEHHRREKEARHEIWAVK
ncbi:Rieske 2Fe-2S family protein [Penicillium cosmopolitanum]|uniref:Choline monooxygenase, chloroplastic n=1 Tax=Penicillium cosmopolitanum TaxID=1131564 RepID=A0A9X0BAW2_9EURO|nr:Rieske 2Fe-2S family protein [Penicillium cosmopolitanum]KAJ5398177.1 Rieske 2Fe-2S family protein [Penicillium cosmopolitanum]